MILSFWRALFQALVIGLGTFGLITGVEFLFTGRLAALDLYAWTSLGVASLVLMVRFCTLYRQVPLGHGSDRQSD